MIRAISLFAIAAAFALAGFVTVRVNATPRFAITPAVQTELQALLSENSLTPVPLADPRGQIIDAALRFRLPGCPADGFLLPLADTTMTDVQSIRFSELTGATYSSSTLTMAAKEGVLHARAARALASLKYAFGLQTARNGHTVLALFTPVNCTEPNADMQAFWEPQPDSEKE
jgi:hypothetical protein